MMPEHEHEGESEEDHEHEHEGESEEDHEHEHEGESEEEHDHEHTEEGTPAPSPDLSAITPITASETLDVVATTSIVADVVRNVGGETINLTVLMPPGTDPHAFEPTPRDVAAVADADVVFANGVGLEEFMDSLLASAGAHEGKVIHVSHGLELLAFGTEHEHEGEPEHEHEGEPEHEHEGEPEHEHEGEPEHEHDHSGLDPHVWFSPANVEGWVDTIARTLRHADPARAESYTSNAAAYREALHDLDTWVREQVAQIPEANRKLVTDHTAFGYFAHRYGFEQIGAVVPGSSTMAEPSAQELAELEDTIRAHQVPAIFVGTTVNPSLSERVAQDTGTRLVPLYTGSLSEAGGPADTYLNLMRFNTRAMVEALRGSGE
jgi:ABC-type Zn uptake system ZnuABC Zn-binding protein ZnuA